MEDTAAAAAEKASSYRYWVREATGDAAPLPVPRKLDPAAAAANGNGNGNPPPLGSVWNQVSPPPRLISSSPSFHLVGDETLWLHCDKLGRKKRLQICDVSCLTSVHPICDSNLMVELRMLDLICNRTCLPLCIADLPPGLQLHLFPIVSWIPQRVLFQPMEFIADCCVHSSSNSQGIYRIS
jgi:hypothetical protein